MSMARKPLQKRPSAGSVPACRKYAAKYKAELAKRETAAGTMVFEVNYGTKSVEVSLASAAHSRLSVVNSTMIEK